MSDSDDEATGALRDLAHGERLRALGEMAAGVAHDFNNILSTILGRARCAHQQLDRGGDVAAELRVIERAAQSATELVARIQSFAKPRSHKTWKPLDLADAKRQAITFVSTSAPIGVSITHDLAPSLTLRGNIDELLEVFVNMMRNSIDAIGDHGNISVRTELRDGLPVAIIQDDGSGMSSEVQERVFEPFYTTKDTSGTGLGLSVSQWILRRHDACLELHSTVGEGTTFEITFGAVDAPEKHAGVHPQALSILVVDDDRRLAEMLRDLLEDKGHHAQIAANREEAQNGIAGDHFDVVITDLDLGKCSGWEIARQVREYEPDATVGLMTGWPLDLPADELRRRGVDFALEKPFTAEALDEALSKIWD